MDRSSNGLDKATKQTITVILSIIALFIGIPVFLDHPLAGIAILSIPALYHAGMTLFAPDVRTDKAH